MRFLEYLDFQTSRKKALYLFAFLASLFILLTMFVVLLPQSYIDLEFSEEIQENQSPILNALMIGISWFGERTVAIFTTLATSLVFLIFKYSREALFIILTLLSSVLNFGLKLLINRPRPTQDMVEIIEKAHNNSFPSGHTVYYVTFYGFLLFLMYRLRNLPNGVRLGIALFCLSLITTVPFSRVYLGAHWFTDVAGGFLFGLLFLYTLIYFYFVVSPKTDVKSTKKWIKK